MSMTWPPHRVKIVSTPSFLSALATKCPPEMTLASRVFRLSVSSAVVVPLLSAVLVAVVSSMDPPFVTLVCDSKDSRGSGTHLGRSSGAWPEERHLQASARRQLRRGINGRGPIRVRAAQGLQDQNRHQRRHDVEHRRRHEYRVPVSFGRNDTG